MDHPRSSVEEAGSAPTPKGTILKRARENKGLSLESAHEATKIPLDALRAIEEGYKVRKISPFYLRGFIKLYAQYLDVKVSDVLDDLPKEKPVLKVQQPIERNTTPDWVKKVFTPETLNQIAIGVAVILALFVVVKAVGAIKQKMASMPPKTEKASAKQNRSNTKENLSKERKQDENKSKQKEKSESKAQEPEIVASKSSESRVESTSSLASGVSLTIRCKKSSWLVVKVDGEVVTQSTFKSGAVESWKAKEKIEISGKNLNQLEFELNGKMIGLLGRGDSRAKAVVFTQAGLSVVK